MTELDVRYGECRVAENVTEAERLIRPESLTKLDEVSAASISAIMVAATSGVNLVKGLFAHLPMLWVVDRHGDIFVALEEVVSVDTFRFLRPKSRRDNMDPITETRLGHPALVDERCEARIGGELLYDPGWGVQYEGWYITNASGRFGIGKGPTNDHLRNVASEFGRLGITVKPVFY